MTRVTIKASVQTSGSKLTYTYNISHDSWEVSTDISLYISIDYGNDLKNNEMILAKI